MCILNLTGVLMNNMCRIIINKECGSVIRKKGGNDLDGFLMSILSNTHPYGFSPYEPPKCETLDAGGDYDILVKKSTRDALNSEASRLGWSRNQLIHYCLNPCSLDIRKEKIVKHKRLVGRPKKPIVEKAIFTSMAVVLKTSNRVRELTDELELKSANATIEFLLNFYEIMK